MYQSNLYGIETKEFRMSISAPRSINRTFMELKQEKMYLENWGVYCINRTFMELKRNTNGQGATEEYVSIEPLYNRRS